MNSRLASPSGDLFLALMALSFPEELICSGPSSSLILLDTLPLPKAGLGEGLLHHAPSMSAEGNSLIQQIFIEHFLR